MWSRRSDCGRVCESAAHVTATMDPCLACGGGDDEGLILLCDVCNGEVHATCNVPSFKGPLLGDWLCAECETPGRRMPLHRKANAKTRRGVGKSRRGCRGRRRVSTSAGCACCVSESSQDELSDSTVFCRAMWYKENEGRGDPTRRAHIRDQEGTARTAVRRVVCCVGPGFVRVPQIICRDCEGPPYSLM